METASWPPIRELVADLIRIRAEWEQVTTARAGSAGRRLLDLLERQPIVDARIVAQLLDVDVRSAQNGIDRLVGDGILRQLGTGARNRLFEAREVLDTLDAFAGRAKRRR